MLRNPLNVLSFHCLLATVRDIIRFLQPVTRSVKIINKNFQILHQEKNAKAT